MSEMRDKQAADRPDEDAAWAAVLRRDRGFDGRFVTGVLSTGIYCRPSCAARHPARRHVRFFADGAAARAAGLRPCKRCAPDDINREEAALARALAAMAAAEGRLALADLADLTGYSPTHFQRLFTRATGLSPAAWQRARRFARAEAAIEAGEGVTDALYQAGYGAPSRYYADAQGARGMGVSAWKAGGRGMTIHWDVRESAFGPMLVAATDKGLCRLAFGEGEGDLARLFPAATLVQGGGPLDGLWDRLAALWAPTGEGDDAADLPRDIAGTPFQQAVWAALSEIPVGETRSYAELAAAIGKPQATRAVGSACGANPLALLIPCHRALRADGTLGGYAWGLEIKRALLAQEKAARERAGDTH